jgi:hypothetical protein
MTTGSRDMSSDMGKNMRLRVAATAYMLVLLASQGTAMSQERSKLVDTGVIFSAQQVESSRDVKMLIESGLTPPFWTPSTEEIAMLEGQLKPYLEHATPPQAKDFPARLGEAKEIAARLASYKRQYFGYTVGDKRWIFVNAFCEAHWKEDKAIWRDRLDFVLDGGPCYFSVRYDQSRSQFEGLWINGGG